MATVQQNVTTQTRAKTIRKISVVFESVYLDNPVELLYPKWTAEGDLQVRRVRMIFVSAAAVIGDTIGTTLALGQDADTASFGSWTSGTSVAIWTVVEIPVPPQNNVLQEGKTLTLFVGKGKTGGGTVNVQVELEETR